jgi:uncharacterized repeat protein (TIGR03943 family)
VLLPWLAAVAFGMIALALISMVRDARRDHGDAAHDHDHAYHGRIGWLIALPVVLLAFVVPPALAPQAAEPVAVTLSANDFRQPFPPLPSGRAPEISMKDVMRRAALDSAGTLYGRLITLIGFTLRTDNRVDLARVSIFCCAADAQLARVHLAGAAADEAGQLADNTWVRVEGVVIPPVAGADPAAVEMPTMTVSTMATIPAPADTYAY